jgi:hypothetical protein
MFGEPETIYSFVEVYYEDDGTPSSYSAPFMYGDNLEELQSIVNRLQEALNHPILNASEFPEPSDALDDDSDFCGYELITLPRAKELDTLWDKSVNKSIKAGDGLARYRYAEQVAAAEREACAKIIYGLCISDNNAQEIVNAIRARRGK